MKTMTCRQMGGPCDFAMRGNTADEVIIACEQHFRDMAAKGDQAHMGPMKMMEDRRKNPEAGMEWYQKTQAAFAALPEDQS
jgi:predicted small metal-binding protein